MPYRHTETRYFSRDLSNIYLFDLWVHSTLYSALQVVPKAIWEEEVS